jgi:hypothetical protein
MEQTKQEIANGIFKDANKDYLDTKKELLNLICELKNQELLDKYIEVIKKESEKDTTHHYYIMSCI